MQKSSPDKTVVTASSALISLAAAGLTVAPSVSSSSSSEALRRKLAGVIARLNQLPAFSTHKALIGYGTLERNGIVKLAAKARILTEFNVTWV